MIARFRVLLPFVLSVRVNDQFSPYQFVRGSYTVKVYPPSEAIIDFTDKGEVSVSGTPDWGGRTAHLAEIFMNGTPTIQANLIQVDFLKDDFDRRRQEKQMALDQGDPSIQSAFDIANDFLARVRAVTLGSQIRSVSPRTAFWCLDYLTDDGNELTETPELLNRRVAEFQPWRISALNANIWKKIQELPENFRPHVWETLLLDAEALLPEVGASIVLAYAALETFVAWCLDLLAPVSPVPPDLWNWVNNRKDFRQEPSVSEQFDILLKVLTAKSLKDESHLWEALQNLRVARNSFSHEGKAVIGTNEITVELAMRLVGQAKAIVDWVELLLPKPLRRPKYETASRTIAPGRLSPVGPYKGQLLYQEYRNGFSAGERAAKRTAWGDGEHRDMDRYGENRHGEGRHDEGWHDKDLYRTDRHDESRRDEGWHDKESDILFHPREIKSRYDEKYDEKSDMWRRGFRDAKDGNWDPPSLEKDERE